MSQEVSTLRLYLMRLLYLLNFALLGHDVWPVVIHHTGTWDPLHGVAYSFWAALSVLSGLGLRYPLRMVPLLLLQLVYKIVWLAAVGIPLWSAGQSNGLMAAMAIGVPLDLVAIPWPYVLTNYVKKPGDRWK